MFHIINLQRINAPEPIKERPPGYSARTIDRKKKVTRSFRPEVHDIPTTDTAKVCPFPQDFVVTLGCRILRLVIL